MTSGRRLARAERDAARKLLARGEDPAERIKLDRIAATMAASSSFKAVADDWLLKVEKEGRSAVTMKKLRWLPGFINASIGKRPIASISAHELLEMLRKMEGKGRYETAKRLRSTCSQVFRYVIVTARDERDVAADLRGALIVPKPVHRAAITSPKPAGELLRPSKALKGIRTLAPPSGSCRMSSYVPESCALPKGRIDFDKRPGRSRHTAPRCGGRIPSLSPARRSRSSLPSRTMRNTAPTSSPRCGRSSG